MSSKGGWGVVLSSRGVKSIYLLLCIIYIYTSNVWCFREGFGGFRCWCV